MLGSQGQVALESSSLSDHFQEQGRVNLEKSSAVEHCLVAELPALFGKKRLNVPYEGVADHLVQPHV